MIRMHVGLHGGMPYMVKSGFGIRNKLCKSVQHMCHTAIVFLAATKFSCCAFAVLRATCNGVACKEATGIGQTCLCVLSLVDKAVLGLVLW